VPGRVTSRSRSPRRPATLVLAVAALLLCALAAPVSAGARVIERLDFETGNLRQWDDVQALPGRVVIVRFPVRQGRFAARFFVRPGDDPIGASGERAEGFELTGEREGVVSWWRWSTRFPIGFRPVPGTWNVFTQWHHSGAVCPPPVSFDVRRTSRGSTIGMSLRGGWLNTTTCESQVDHRWAFTRLRRARWYTFRFHVKWCSCGGGFVEVWMNGRKVVPKTYTPTLYAGQFVYVKQGYVRGPAAWRASVFHDGLTRYRPS
jgi:hypothetical protein